VPNRSNDFVIGRAGGSDISALDGDDIQMDEHSQSDSIDMESSVEGEGYVEGPAESMQVTTPVGLAEMAIKRESEEDELTAAGEDSQTSRSSEDLEDCSASFRRRRASVEGDRLLRKVTPTGFDLTDGSKQVSVMTALAVW
jgi:hypothetical protein